MGSNRRHCTSITPTDFDRYGVKRTDEVHAGPPVRPVLVEFISDAGVKPISHIGTAHNDDCGSNMTFRFDGVLPCQQLAALQHRCHPAF